MNWRSLPPLSALRAFAAFAETGSVIAAGEALGVSHAAISQQLRALEGHLDTALLDRSGRALRLTSVGEDLARALHAGFAAMINATEAILAAQDDRPLHISTTPTFAASWLMPRLPKFRALHPEVDLMLDPTPQVVTLASGGIDVAIRYGDGTWAGVQSEMLLSSPMVVVAAPSLVGEETLPSMEALGDFPWLEEAFTNEASRWLTENGVRKSLRNGVTQVPGNLLLDGARDGQGVAMTVRAFVQRDIAAGRLRQLVTHAEPGHGYHIVTRPGVMRPVLKDFVRWLRREGAAAAEE